MITRTVFPSLPRHRLARLGSALMAVSLIASACAKEQSDEERRREREVRALKRLASAGGGFQGFVTLDNGSSAPVWLTIGSHNNPVAGTPTPTLEVALQVGFFGGVTLAADESHYDNGAGQLTATFRRSNGSPLELRARIARDGNVSGVIDGPNAPARAITLNRVANLTIPTSPEWTLQITSRQTLPDGSDAGPTRGVLNLKRGTLSIPAPSQSDLPLLPPLEGSIRWEGSLNMPLPLQAISYDPLKGTMELNIRDGARLRVDNVAVDSSNADASTLTSPTLSLNGEILNGSNVVSTLTVFTRPGLTLADTNYVVSPSRDWVGRYTSFGGLTYDVFATITELTQEGVNPADSVFPKFKKLSVGLSFCQDGRRVIGMSLSTASFDHLTRVIRLETPQSSTSEPWRLAFAPDWTRLTGSGSLSLTAPDKRGSIDLTAWTGPMKPDCSNIIVTP